MRARRGGRFAISRMDLLRLRLPLRRDLCALAATWRSLPFLSSPGNDEGQQRHKSVQHRRLHDDRDATRAPPPPLSWTATQRRRQRRKRRTIFELCDGVDLRGFAARSVREEYTGADASDGARMESTSVAPSLGREQRGSLTRETTEGDAAKPKVDANALKRARIEIEKMRREQHINFAKRTYKSVTSVTKYIISWGPYSVQLLRQSPSEWKVTLNSAWKHAKHEFAHYWSSTHNSFAPDQ